MTTAELLRFVRLLSALESFLLSQKTSFPDYLHEDLSRCMELLEQKILDNETNK